MSRFNSSRRDPLTPELFVSKDLYGLKFFNEVEDLVDLDTRFLCTPNISLIDNNTKIVLDFNGCSSTHDKTLLTTILAGISGGTDGITLSNAKHVDARTGEESDLSGTFTYNANYDSTIVADVVSVELPQNYDKHYKSTGFLGNLQVEFAASNITSNLSNTVKNVFGSSITPSFTSMGAVQGDYIKFSDGDNSGILYEIAGMSFDSSNYEILTLTQGNSYEYRGVTQENRFNIKTNTNLYKVGNISEQTPSSSTLSYTNRVSKIDFNLLNDGSGKNVFGIGSSIQPTIYLYTGNVYIFNYSSQGLISGSHVLRLSTTNQGIHGGGSLKSTECAFFDGCFVFSPAIAQTLYYYCTNHSGMGSKIIVSSSSVANSSTNYNFSTLQVGQSDSILPAGLNSPYYSGY
tara:strand:- start:183 stop:1391 length:1209 start_codon:yes stop_codon:yes gene_type:complete